MAKAPAKAPATKAPAKTPAQANGSHTPDVVPAPVPVVVSANYPQFLTKDSKYPIHPIAAVFPKQSAEELRDLEESIRARGVQMPVAVWKHDGVSDVIDGRSRYGVLEKLWGEGLTNSADGKPLQ